MGINVRINIMLEKNMILALKGSYANLLTPAFDVTAAITSILFSLLFLPLFQKCPRIDAIMRAPSFLSELFVQTLSGTPSPSSVQGK